MLSCQNFNSELPNSISDTKKIASAGTCVCVAVQATMLYDRILITLWHFVYIAITYES